MNRSCKSSVSHRLHCQVARSISFARIAVVALAATAIVSADEPLRERWRVPIGLHTPVNAIVGRLNGDAIICVGGAVEQGDRKHATVVTLDAHGAMVWQSVHEEQGASSLPGAYLQWIPARADESPAVVYSFVPGAPGEPSGAVILNAASGLPRNRLANLTHFGNNNSIVADVDRDGVVEFLYADQQNLSCYSTLDWTQEWTSNTGVVFCWSLPALVDVNGDGQDEIVFGSEYNNDDQSSSMVAINAAGNPVWRSDGHAEDLGSTPVFVHDVEGDGASELLKVGLDLEHRRSQDWNHLHVFDLHGTLLRRIPFGCTGIALGDLDGDGVLEGVGITNTRDGGHQARHAIRCVDLATGEVQWSTDVTRAYLDNNSPVMGDFDGDGKLEAVVGTGNPAGYARLPNSRPWGDLYVVDSGGSIEQHIELPGWPVNSALCDLDADGASELIVVIDGKPGWIAVYDTHASSRRNDWPTPFGTPRRDGTSQPVAVASDRIGSSG
ncbi:MAG: VCBS repeat-containing protein [Candidatus Hydrogenedentes bacterium]|nr:VCBS repeat-containing protein [Candidatus Hydrogenedentota bacterium]